jgi:hypothetical protein
MTRPQRAFPPLPTFGAHWLPVYWEPIHGSGERITIMVCARSETGWHVQETVSSATWKCFLGHQSGTARRLIGLMAESLRTHLAGGGRLKQWKPPLSGVATGEEHYTLGRDINDIVRQALTDTSAFASLPSALDFDEDAGEADADEADRWPVQVRAAVVSGYPDMARFFARRLTLREGARDTLIDFAGQRYCSNFIKLMPDIRMGYWLGQAKIRLLDLEQVRAHAAAGDLFNDDNASLPTFELLMYRPNEEDPAYTGRAMQRLSEASTQLEDFADSHNMRLVVARSPQQAADRLIEKEAA